MGLFPSKPNLLNLPLELKLMIIDELKEMEVGSSTAFNMRQIWPDLKGLILTRIIDTAYLNDEDGSAEADIEDEYEKLKDHPWEVSTGTKGFFLSQFTAPQSASAAVRIPALFSSFTNMHRLDFHQFEFALLDMTAFCAAVESMPSLREISLTDSKVELRHLYALFDAIAGIEDITLNLMGLHIPDLQDPDEEDGNMTPEIVYEFQPDIIPDFTDWDLPPFEGTFRARTLDYAMMTMDDYLFLDVLNNPRFFGPQPQIQSLIVRSLARGVDNFARRLNRMLERMRPTLQSLRIRQCNYIGDHVALQPMGIAHLSKVHFQISMHGANPVPILGWFAESFNTLPMRLKLDSIFLEIMITDYTPSVVHVLPKESKDRHPEWRMLDRALTREMLDVSSVEYKVAVHDEMRMEIEDGYGLEQWLLEVCLPATWKKYFPTVAFEKPWLPPSVAEDLNAENRNEEAQP
ncbi:hypothetical protein BDZ89DRAFT_251857 [Hymenopellis radicata]|nr:hypothetical protein BDZ89DRAFT_251857 [Hymenopellis radicata]